VRFATNCARAVNRPTLFYLPHVRCFAALDSTRTTSEEPVFDSSSSDMPREQNRCGNNNYVPLGIARKQLLRHYLLVQDRKSGLITNLRCKYFHPRLDAGQEVHVHLSVPVSVLILMAKLATIIRVDPRIMFMMRSPQ